MGQRKRPSGWVGLGHYIREDVDHAEAVFSLGIQAYDDDSIVDAYFGSCEVQDHKLFLGHKTKTHDQLPFMKILWCFELYYCFVLCVLYCAVCICTKAHQGTSVTNHRS